MLQQSEERRQVDDDFGRDVLRGIVDRIHGIDVSELHHFAVGQSPRLVKLPPLQTRFEDLHCGHLSANDHRDRAEVNEI